jgi:hypothetical protein
MMLGTLLLAVWLIATGLLPFFKIRFAHTGMIMNIVAIAAGVLILLGR